MWKRYIADKYNFVSFNDQDSLDGRGVYCHIHPCEFDPATSLCLGDIVIDDQQNPSMAQVVLRQVRSIHFVRVSHTLNWQNTSQFLSSFSHFGVHDAIHPAVSRHLFVFKDSSYLTQDRLVYIIILSA